MTEFDPYDALVPVFSKIEISKRVVQIGTAIFCNIWNEPFLLTAAHVTDDLHNGTLLVPTRDGLQPIEGYMAHIDLPPELSRSKDSVDIAYYRLSTEFAFLLAHQFKPFPQQRNQIIDSALDLTVCSASGYPASKSKKNADGVFSSEIFSFRGAIADKDTYDRLDLSPDQAIIIQFSKKRAINPESMKTFATPSLNGISGGGIFAWPAGRECSDDWSLPRLVGIVHTFKEREGLIIGTTLLPMLGALTLGRMKRFGGVK